MGYQFRLPAIDGVAGRLSHLELFWLIVSVQLPALRAEPAGTAGELFGQLANDLEGVALAVAVSGQGHMSELLLFGLYRVQVAAVPISSPALDASIEV